MRALPLTVVGLVLAMAAVGTSSAADIILLEVAKAEVAPDPLTQVPALTLLVQPGDSQALAKYTTHHLGAVIEFVLDDQVLAAPMLLTSINNGQLHISGTLAERELLDMAQRLTTGKASLMLRRQAPAYSGM